MKSAPDYAVVGRSETFPTLYHLHKTKADAERLRVRREAISGQPCYVVLFAEWQADPLGTLQGAERAARR
jgi:hypothetical protein